jgi:transmembrane sensor
MMKAEGTDSTSGRGDDLDWVRHANATDEILAGLAIRAQRRRVRRLGIAGAFALALTCAVVWQVRPAPETSGEHPVAVVSTLTVIQPRSQLLPDGSFAELTDGAEIAVNYTADFRRVALVRGAAHFAVAKNPARPFIVSSHGVEVRAVGTAFAVDAVAQAVEVVVTEGRVTVESSAAAESRPQGEHKVLAAISAGQSTVVQPGAISAEIEKLDESAMRMRLSWRIPRIEFSKTPLAEVVAELNKHNRTQFVLADDSIGHFQISGAVRADRVDALIDMLASDFGLQADRNADRILLRRGR